MKSYTCKRPAALVINDIVKLLYNSTVALREGGSVSHYLKTRGNEEENNGVTEFLLNLLPPSTPNIPSPEYSGKSTGQSQRPGNESWLHR